MPWLWLSDPTGWQQAGWKLLLVWEYQTYQQKTVGPHQLQTFNLSSLQPLQFVDYDIDIGVIYPIYPNILGDYCNQLWEIRS